MHAGEKFTLRETLYWTRRDIYKFLLIGLVPTALYVLLDWHFLSVPWLPVALVGTALAFLVGFKNNASYDRLWEARKVWGAIVNDSRTWAMMSIDYVTNKHASVELSPEELKSIHQRLIYRHIAWLTALRHQLRQKKGWETMEKIHNVEFRKFYDVAEQDHKLEDDLKPFLSAEEYTYVLSKKNRATHILKQQSRDLRELYEKGYIEDFRHMELENILRAFFEHQGKSERIKNFPYPRHFATVNNYFIWIFIFLAPLGMIEEFNTLAEKLNPHLIWLTVPFSALISWVFHTMDKLGTSTENPFEGSAIDVPITSLSRTIEIDLREMLDETDLPAPVPMKNNIIT